MNVKNLRFEVIEREFPYKPTKQWHWQHDNDDYHTDKYSSGMWRNDKQFMGTCDFHIYAKTISGARKQLNKFFNAEY